MEYRPKQVAQDIEAYLAAQRDKTLLRFIACGSVDDGKSTLIGRMLYESQAIFEDQLAALSAESRRFGTQGEALDLALLVDGLSAEREQGITIDVAYRYFTTDRRKFIVADTPGHEQYTRNMATGASTAELAVVMVDARKGVITQTRRHSAIVALLGVKHVALAVNKMDLVDYSQSVFNDIDEDYRAFAERIGIEHVVSVPVSALVGDNVASQSENTPWYYGPSLLEHLETVDVARDERAIPMRMPVQWVSRPDHSFRGFAGRIVSGAVAPGERVRVLPSGRESHVARIVTAAGDLEEAVAGQSVTLTLEDELDVSRGDVIAAAAAPCPVSDQFAADIVWMSEEPMLPGRPYVLKLGTRTATCTVAKPRHKLNVNTLEELAASQLELNEIGVCNISLDRPVAFDAYADNREMGGFILIDRLTNDTVGMGMLRFALRRADNIHWQALDVDRSARAAVKGQKPVLLWFTGLSGAGKSTIANAVERRLHSEGRHTMLLDGDNVRHGLNRDLGFTDADRVENIRRVGEVARLMTEAGLITLVSFISPFRSERRMARELMGEGEFIEVFVDAPLEVAEQRDPKGLYRKARAGELTNFTGIDSPYEAPEAPEIHVDTTQGTADTAAESIVAFLRSQGIIG